MSASNEIQQVCVIGLGNMGSALAEVLLATGQRVTVWNRTSSKWAPLADLGAEVVGRAADAVKASDTVVICVLDDEASNEVLSSPGMDAALHGKTLLQFTTLEPSAAQAEAKWMQERAVRYLEGAILGFPADVRSGTAQMAFSGAQDAVDGAKNVIDSLAGRAVHVGERPGKASQAALLVYARYYGIAFACLHTAALAKAADIPMRQLLELTGGKDGWQNIGGVMDQYLEMVGKADYSTSEATLELDAGDYDMFIRLSRDLGVDPAHHKVIDGVLSAALAQGWGDQAIPAICEVLSPSSKATKPTNAS